MNGGYFLIDCDGLELTAQETQTLPGIYQEVQKAMETNKPVVVYNATYDSELMSPIEVMIVKRPSGNYIATSSVLQIEITENDTVTITDMTSGGGSQPQESIFEDYDCTGMNTKEEYPGYTGTKSGIYNAFKHMYDNNITPRIIGMLSGDDGVGATVSYIWYNEVTEEIVVIATSFQIQIDTNNTYTCIETLSI